MKLIDIEPGSRTNRFREQRMRLFLAFLDRLMPTGVVRILDVGGEPSHWMSFSDLLIGRSIEITIVNLKTFNIADPRFRSVIGDATDLSPFEHDQFDVVYSNSVIEHVGRWQEMKMMASGIAKVSHNFFVQTPNFWFPVEPHFRFPLFHWLPEPARLQIVMARSNGFYPRAATIDDGMRMVQSSAILTAKQFQSLFPKAKIIRERFGPFTKSLIAVSSEP